jgi:hypothetical protein
MSMKSLRLFVLTAVAATALYGQSTGDPVYWSSARPDCSSLGTNHLATITNSSGGTIGYSCWVAGTFTWLAAGAGWTTSIRFAAPASGAVGADYYFYDINGNEQSFDTTINRGSTVTASASQSFALFANQPSEFGLLGVTGTGPAYNTTGAGSAYAVFYCPTASTCLDVLPQLIYSALPGTPWSLSAPIAWDTQVWKQWSAVGVDDGGSNLVSLVIYNEGTATASPTAAYTIRIYDSTGALFDTRTTPSIPGFKNGVGQAGTYGALLRDLFPALPSGAFKILVDGGASYSGVAILQFTGASATTLQVAYDSAPTGSAAAAASSSRLDAPRAARQAPVTRTVFRGLPRQ